MDPLVDLVELLRSTRPAWHADAACREHPEIDFFPARGQDTTAATAVCTGCLVRTECLTAALDGLEVGIWGGTSQRQRRRHRSIALRSTDDLSVAS